MSSSTAANTIQTSITKAMAAASVKVTSASGAGKAHAKEDPAQTIYVYFWYSIATVLALLVALRVYLWVYRLQARRQARKGTSGSSGSGKLARFRCGLEKEIFLRTIPWVHDGANVAEIVWTVGYSLLSFLVATAKTYNNPKNNWAEDWGAVSYAQLPLIVGLASRNSVLSCITGVPYHHFQYLHRAAGRVMTICGWVHTIGYCVRGLGKHGPGNRVFTSGVCALAALMIVVFSSFRPTRRVFYEIFIALHIIFVLLFLVGLYFHRPKLSYWLWSSLVIWAFDRIASFARLVIYNEWWLRFRPSTRDGACQMTVELVDHDIIRITAHRRFISWSAGQHAYITIPTIAKGRWEQHPISIATVPSATEGGDMVFLVRAYTGFTRHLYNAIPSEGKLTVRGYLDGPYALKTYTDHCHSVLLIAGGTGITHPLSYLLQILTSPSKKSITQSVHLIWAIRHHTNYKWIEYLLEPALARARIEQPELRVRIDIYITKSEYTAAEDVGLPAGYVGGGPESPHIESSGSSEHGEKVDSRSSSTSGSTSNGCTLEKENSAPIPRRDDEKMDTSNSVVMFHSGRPNLSARLSDDLAGHNGKQKVIVCGPMDMVKGVRDAIIEVDKFGQVDCDSEVFGW